MLTDSCIERFTQFPDSRLFKTYYFDDYDLALSWLEDKYQNDGATINVARFQKDGYLDKTNPPLVILEVMYKLSDNLYAGMKDNGALVYCDKDKMIYGGKDGIVVK